MSNRLDADRSPRSLPPRAGANTRVVVALCMLTGGMLGLSYAAVPLYEMFCRVTGYGGTTQRAESPPAQGGTGRMMQIRFDANTSGDLDWKFKPVSNTMDVEVGVERIGFYRAENTSQEPLVGTATFNVTPEIAGSYFNKIECFCFTEQRLEPGESMEMPVSFFIDPDMLKDPDARDLQSVTLSYTFFPVKQPQATDLTAVEAGNQPRG